ncbi:hypothetical protein GCM10023238_36140 [Streptomyces heliomycini]
MSDDEQAGGAADDAPGRRDEGRSSDSDGKKAGDDRGRGREDGKGRDGKKGRGDRRTGDERSRDDDRDEDDDEKSAEDEDDDEAAEKERERERERAAGRFKERTRDPLADEQGEEGSTDLAAAARTRRATRQLFDVRRDLISFAHSRLQSAHIGDNINLLLGSRHPGAGMRSGPVPEEELRRLRRVHVEPQGYVRLRNALRARRLLVLGAAPGTGRTSTALSLLDEVTQRPADARTPPAPGCCGSIRRADRGSWPGRWTAGRKRSGAVPDTCWNRPSPGPARCPRTRWTSTSSPRPWTAARPSR